MKEQFYQKALPSSGIYCVTGIDKNKRPINWFAETYEELAGFIDKLSEDGYNVFVAMSSFNGHSRKAEYAKYSRSFFIDLDVGSGKGYQSKGDALSALRNFIDSTGIPEPVVVDSGTGIHAYWIFTEDIQIVEWKAYATKFKDYVSSFLNIDPVVTSDVSRIMRSPGTWNHKSEPPKAVSIISEDIPSYEFSLFKEFLGEVSYDVNTILATAEKGLDEDTAALTRKGNFSTSFAELVDISLRGRGCGQVKHMVEDASTLPEPLWFAGINLARNCEDRDTAIHKLSEDYPNYSYEETERKAKNAVDGIISCKKLDTLNPGICGSCPFNGKVSNPLWLVRRLQEAPTTTETEPIRINTDTKEVPKFPEFLNPFKRGKEGGIYMVVEGEDDEPPKHILICTFDLFPVKRMFSQHDGECLLVRHIMPHDPCRETMLPLSYLGSLDKFKATLGAIGVAVIHQGLWQKLVDYMTKWAIYLQGVDTAEQMRMHMGWTEDNESFVLGNHEYFKDGSTRITATSPHIANNIARLLKPYGSYGLWRKAATTLDTPGLEFHAFAMLCSFGSPLMRLTSTNGVTVSLAGKTGAAKTGAMYSTLSVWGNPKELNVFEATDNAITGRYLGLRNLPFCLDEITQKFDMKGVSQLIHRISQGKAKIRMQSSVNAERELEMAASLIAISTTNEPLQDRIITEKSTPDGEIARLVEFHLPAEAMNMFPMRGKEVFDVFRLNYGHAGPDYVKYLLEKGDNYIHDKIIKWTMEFKRYFGNEVGYRYYENLIGVTFAGGELAEEAGIVKFDLHRIFTVVVAAMQSNRDNTIRLNDHDYEELVAQFLLRNHNGFLVMEDDRVLHQPVNAPLIGRIEVHNQTQFVGKLEFRKFLAERHASSREFETVMKRRGLLIDVPKQRLTRGWKAGMQTSPVAVYAFKTELPKELLSAQEGSSQDFH